MEIVGRFPTEKEATSMTISMKSPIWLPAADHEDINQATLKKLQELRE